MWNRYFPANHVAKKEAALFQTEAAAPASSGLASADAAPAVDVAISFEPAPGTPGGTPPLEAEVEEEEEDGAATTLDDDAATAVSEVVEGEEAAAPLVAEEEEAAAVVVAPVEDESTPTFEPTAAAGVQAVDL